MSQHRQPTAPPRQLTDKGLPLDHTQLGTAITTSEVGDGGPSRRIDCRPPRLISAPSISASKSQPSDARRVISLDLGPVQSSLIDDDDDEIMDYFGMDACAAAPIFSPASPAEAASSTACWDIREHQVPVVPSFYPLEKSSVFVPHASAPVLAARVAAVLRARSISASYDPPNCKVDCVSKSNVEFRVRLYRGRGDRNHGIIVEVQRRSGFDLSFNQDVYAVLDSAEGKDFEDCRGEMTTMYYDDTDVSVGNVTSEGEDMDSLECMEGFASLQIISDILCPQDSKSEEVALEGHDFALSSLLSLTSRDRMGRAAAQFSMELLTSEVHSDLRHAVFSKVGQCPVRPAERRAVLQSLEVLANVATFTKNHNPLMHLLSESGHEILLKLIVNIENAMLNPRAADLSCLALKNIYVSATGEDIVASHHKERLLAGLMGAVTYGRECHADLETHSQQLLELLLQL